MAELVGRVAESGPAVVCVHRENLPAAVRAACAAYGAHAPAELAVPKGGYWVMRVLVTGATGFVGGGIVRALLADGHEVHGLVRDPGAAPALHRAGVITYAGDMREPATYVPLVGQMDAVAQAVRLGADGRIRPGARSREFVVAISYLSIDSVMRRVIDAAYREGSRSESTCTAGSGPAVRVLRRHGRD